MWTQFWDMHSGGSLKEKQHYIYIEAPEDEAKVIFYNRFGHNPERVTCTCCGEDYSISEDESLDELTAFHRGQWREKGPKVSLEDYRHSEEALFIPAEEIQAEERQGEVPQQGYMWVG